MANHARPAGARTVARRYPLVGGGAAWYLPLVAAAVTVSAAAFGALEVGVVSALSGWAAHRLTRNFTLELSATGLTRGFLAMEPIGARTTSIPWSAVVEVHTAWYRPAEDLALETTVRDGTGRTLRLSTSMGLTAYWTCLAEIVRRAPGAARTGLTDRALAEGPPAPRDVVSAIGTAAVLALILAALVSVHALWAQGCSSLARDLSRIGAVGEAPGPACAGSAPAAVVSADRCR